MERDERPPVKEFGNDQHVHEHSPSIPQELKQKLERNDTIEILRIVAACGVIWFHLDTTPYKRVGYAGLVFFLIVAVLFQAQTVGSGSIQVFFQKRTRRLLVPWIVWFLLYGVLNLAVGKPFFPQTTGLLQHVAGGPWIGLWFLPFSFASAVMVYSLTRALGSSRAPMQFIGWSAVSVLSLIGVSSFRQGGLLVAPWAQWLQAAPSLPIGLAIYAALACPKGKVARLVFLQTSVLLTCVFLYSADPGMALSYGLGSLAATIGFLFPRRMTPVIGSISALCLGVYLIHGAVISGFKFVPWVTSHYLTWFVCTVGVSFLLVAGMRRVPCLNKIV